MNARSGRLARAVVAAVVAVGGAAAVPVAGGPGEAVAAATSKAPTARRDPAGRAAPFAAGLPAVTLPPVDDGLTAPVGVASTTLATKPGLVVTLESTYAAVFINPAYRYSPDPVPVPDYFLPDKVKQGCRYESVFLDADIYPIGLVGADPARPGAAGRLTQVGDYPTTTAQFLAFGAIPASATIRATQVFDGKPEPLRLSTPTGFSTEDERGRTCDDAWSTTRPPPYLTRVDGALDLYLSDVTVDSVHLDVGGDCHLADPLQLNLYGQPTTYSDVLHGGTLVDRRDDSTVTVAGSTYPLYPDSTDLTVPPFTGCASPTGEDLDPLVTGLVSGPGNTLAVQQTLAPLAAFPADGGLYLCDQPVTDPPNCTAPATVPAPLPRLPVG